MQVVFAILIACIYLVAPLTLIWGWIRWVARPKSWSSSILSLIGFTFATASAALAISVVLYAHAHHFGYYDPLLLQIFRWGGLLSIAGILFGVLGWWRENPLRWHSPICAIGTLAFWLIAAGGE